jgi:protease-4
VDSPGGSVTGSERIRRVIRAVRERGIPVVVSFGSVAASGGYWIATAGDTILAEPSTITGSIGVFGILPSFERTLQQIGVGADGVGTTPLSGQPDIFRGISPQTGQIIQMGIDNTYRNFLVLVSRARRLPVERVHEVAQGRVWDGGTARQLGLVDRFGSLQDAIGEAARRANIDPAQARPLFLEPEPNYWSQLARAFADDDGQPVTNDVFTRLGRRPEMLLQQALADADILLSGPAIQVRCLECAPAVAAPVSPQQQASLMRRLLASLVGG